MAFENWKLNRKVHKQEKKIAKKEELAQTTVRANDSMTNITNRTEKIKEKLNAEEWYSKHLDRANLDTEIHEARQNLFIQRERLLRRLITFNREYKYILQKPDTSIKRRELERCSTGAKNAAYALAIVDEAIDRLDNIRSEHEWRDIMRDLTKGYKLVNAVSIGSDLMTRLAFWMQKAKSEIKGDISVEAMEYYFGMPIDKLLEEQTGSEKAADMLIENSVLDLEDEDAVLEAIRWGTVFTVTPNEASNVAEQQSNKAKSVGGTPIFTKPDETFKEVKDFSAINIDDLPTMF